jgi:capsular exopolysaccharide synthesis family protein
MEFKAIWSIILRRKWIIIQAFLVISLTTIAASYLLTPIYQTTAKVLNEKSVSESYLLSNIGLQNKNMRTSADAEKEAENNLAVATSKPVLEKVISKLQLTDSNGDLMKPDDLLEYTFVKDDIFPKPYVEVNIVEDSNLIEIVSESTDPEEAAMIANTLAKEYIEESIRRKREEYRTAKNNIEKQIESIRTNYLSVLENIKNFQLEENTVNIEQETNRAIENMFTLLKAKEDNIINISEVQAKIKTLKEQLDKQDETRVASSSISENKYIEELKKTIIENELKLEEALAEKTEEHADVMIINQKLKKARAELKKEIGLLGTFSTEIQRLERELAALQAHRLSLDAAIEKFKTQLYAIPTKAFSNAQLKLDYEVTQELYSSMLEYLYQIVVAEAVIFSDIRLVEAALVPDIDDVEFPKIVLNSILGILLGGMFGLGLGFLVDYMDDTVKGVGDVRKQGLTILGSVPKVKEKTKALISGRDSTDRVSEFHRMIRNNLKYSCLDKPVRSLLITSATNGEGRSTVVVNLGVTFAREGKRVLIVDADFRNPALNELTNIPNLVGLSNVLTGEVSLNAVIKDVPGVEGMSFLPSGSLPSDPSRMVESEKMSQLLAELARQYDLILLDSSPILVSNDAVSLAKNTDATILVVESGKISRRSFSRTIEHLKSSNVPLIGAIINKFPVSRRGELL